MIEAVFFLSLFPLVEEMCAGLPVLEELIKMMATVVIDCLLKT